MGNHLASLKLYVRPGNCIFFKKKMPEGGHGKPLQYHARNITLISPGSHQKSSMILPVSTLKPERRRFSLCSPFYPFPGCYHTFLQHSCLPVHSLDSKSFQVLSRKRFFKMNPSGFFAGNLDHLHYFSQF